ncbi:uncharacterized protein LOC127724426 isoform X2 [Mytilus californianus]|uniref:uncharacterized protein LOC127724426 isoform X2 n=1 Tax=Mytilus californianus TaxID=6549 RepID=UPI002248300B|nr:uncharacterized protein LOC127724426 isoform X2 [Mytilus californianus]XP_052087349.1 uncharacterized protein LOC127724426 isoform X2 [Mytilus californianus]
MVKMDDPNYCNNNFAGAQEESGRAKLDITLPTGSKFKYFSKTQAGTVFQAEILKQYVLNENTVKRKERTEKKKRQSLENVVTQDETTFIDKNIQDNPHFRQLDNIQSLLNETLCQSVPFQNVSSGSSRGRKEQEKGSSMAITYRGEETRLKSYSTEELYIDQQACLLISLKYSKGNMQRRKPCMLFICRDKMYSPSAFLQKVQGKGQEEFNQAIYVTAFSETDGYLNIEFMKGISKELAISIAKVIKNNSLDLELIRLADILRLFETNDIFEQTNLLSSDINPEDSITDPGKDNDNHFNDINDNCIQNNGMNTYQESTDWLIRNHVNDHTDSNAVLSDRNKFTEPKTLNVGNNNTEKKLRNNTGLQTQWTDRSKMKNSKVRTQSKPVRELKIYLQSVEVDFGGLVNEYFGDNMIRQAVYGFCSPDVDRRSKTSFDRPNVPWPSMHPLLPYKLRYLDENEEISHLHRNQEQYDEVQNDLNTENRDNYSSDGDADQYDSCASDFTDEIDNDNG